MKRSLAILAGIVLCAIGVSFVFVSALIVSLGELGSHPLADALVLIIGILGIGALFGATIIFCKLRGTSYRLFLWRATCCVSGFACFASLFAIGFAIRDFNGPTTTLSTLQDKDTMTVGEYLAAKSKGDELPPILGAPTDLAKVPPDTKLEYVGGRGSGLDTQFEIQQQTTISGYSKSVSIPRITIWTLTFIGASFLVVKSVKRGTS